MVGLYIVVSEMSIVGPPPRFLGGVFFCSRPRFLLDEAGAALRMSIDSAFGSDVALRALVAHLQSFSGGA